MLQTCFKDEDLKVWYLGNQAFTRRLEYRTDLIADFARSALAARYVRLASKLGRLPLPDECSGYERLVEQFGSPKRLERLLLQHIDRTSYDGSRTDRRADILTYLAMLRLEGLHVLPFHALPVGVQADIKAFGGGYAAAADEG